MGGDQQRPAGARFAVPAEATAIALDSGYYRVRLADGTSLTSTSVVIATGARYRRLPVPRLDEFEDTCVFYAATAIEAASQKRRPPHIAPKEQPTSLPTQATSSARPNIVPPPFPASDHRLTLTPTRPKKTGASTP